MKYISTRGMAPSVGFKDALIQGLAPDGGLYVPMVWPSISETDLKGFRGLSYAEQAARVMWPFLGSDIEREAFDALVEKAYAGFGHKAVAPLVQVDDNIFLQELFHGPTLAFKDIALQMLGHLFDHVLAERGERITVVGATSGDTGSAAIEGCRGRDNIDIFILHPAGRTSDVQRRQMTTVDAPNVFNIAVEGTFDDCQSIVKMLFADQQFRTDMNLSAVNSINWARILAQIVYYVTGAVALGAPDRMVSYAVPTGNFGNIFAAYAADKITVPVEKLIIGSNTNDILTRFYETGAMEKQAVTPTISPSMDIQISSNFERLMFDLTGQDSTRLIELLKSFVTTGKFEAPEMLGAMRVRFGATRADDETTLKTIGETYAETGLLIDPHTAVGLHAAKQAAAAKPGNPVPIISMACAHPAKFPDAVEKATGIRPELPARLADLFERPEKYDTLGADKDAIAAYIRQRARRGGAAQAAG